MIIPKGSILYHATLTRDVDSILTYGLTPHSLETWLGPQEQRTGTYLALAKEHAVNYAQVCIRGQIEFDEQASKWSLLKVVTPWDIEAEPDEEMVLDHGHGGVIVFEALPPQGITYVESIII